MKKILKYELGESINLGTLNLNNYTIKAPTIPYSYYLTTRQTPPDYTHFSQSNPSSESGSNGVTNSLVAGGIDALSNYTGLYDIFGDSEIGRQMGTMFSSGVTAATNTMTNNLLKGSALASGLSKNVGSALSGTAAGIASNYIGKGITAAMGGDSTAKAMGAGTATALGTIGGLALSNLAKFGKVGQLIGKGAGMVNPYGLAAQVIGSAIGAATGPSKEYGGKYGTEVLAADTAYDAATVAANAIPVAGLLISGMMALNKGISNIFGSTDGMTLQDSILGSAWVGAPFKWLNMINAKTTRSFNNLSWLNSEKANSFMGNAFGDLGDKFDRARNEAGKTYGLFSSGAYHAAQNRLNFANKAWDEVLAMADLNDVQNIRSLIMTSINNQKYAQDIQGGWNPIYRGKQGMKIFNNATDHKIGMRLLSGAALIDSKQMILCGAVD